MGPSVEHNSVIEVRYHDSVNVLQGLSLQAGVADAQYPFDRTEWFGLLADAGHKPLIAVASDGQTHAAMALSHSDGRIVSLRNWYSFTWRPHATAGPAGHNLLVELARVLKARSHRVVLEPIPNEDGSAHRIVSAFEQAGWKVSAQRCDTNHILHVEGRSFDEYWSTRPGPLRTTLKRKASRVDTTILTQFDAEAWQRYEEIYAASWKPHEDQPDMLRSFAKAEGEAGRLRLGIAMTDGKPIAAQFWTVENGIAYIHKLAHLESHKKLSAGTTLSAALFRHVIDCDGVALVDFGTGDEPYKVDWMEEVRPRYRIDCIDPRAPKGWIALAKRAYARLRSPGPPSLARRAAAG